MGSGSSGGADRDLSAAAAEVLSSPVTDELRHSFLEYAMSVIVSRALPDVRDGLKPVQRRILWSMHRNRLRPDSGYRKSATVVGDVMAHYHPHGDAAIYDTMVRMAQPFANMLPPIDGQGNFGTPDDPAAAARYTEARMMPSALLMTSELGEDTVDMRPNYDGKETEPTALPARVPYLLVNGATGIAVGLATRMAPHNLVEVVAALKHLLAHPDASVDDLMRHLPGPDLPTGGIVIDDEGGVRDAYLTGRGRFRMRAHGEVTEVSARRKGVVFTELPYEVGPEKVVARVNQLLGEKKLPGVSKVVNLTDRKGTRLVVEFKTGFSPDRVLADLYRLTPLEESFSMNQIALVDGRPRVLGLVELCQLFLDHRFEVVRRRTSFRLQKAEARAHIVEGLIVALDAIDEVVSIIRASRTADAARTKLRRRFSLSEVQANHILDMQLRRLTSMEVSTLRAELKELRARIKDLSDLLSSRPRQAQVIAGELDEVSELVGVPRRSRMVKELEEVSFDAPVDDAPAMVTLSAAGLVARREVPSAYRPSHADALVAHLPTSLDAQVGLVTSHGMLRVARVADLPQPAGRSKGGLVTDFFTLESDERPVGLVRFDATQPLVLMTAGGQVKRLAPAELKARDGMSLMRLEPGERIVSAFFAADDDDLVAISAAGQLLRFAAGTVRPQGRAGGGVAGMRLAEGDRVLCCGLLAASAAVVTVSDAGRTKVTAASEYPRKGRATSGVRCHRLLKGEEGLVFAAVAVSPTLLARTATVPPDGLVGRRDASGVLPEEGAVVATVSAPLVAALREKGS